MSKELIILEKIATNTATSIDPVWVAVTTGGTGVLIALITTFIGYLNSKNNITLERDKIKAEIITKERLIWSNNLRDNASEYYCQMDSFYSFLKREITVDIGEYQKEIDEVSKNISKKSNDLLLVLNTNDEKQLLLFDSINAAQLFILNCSHNKTRKFHNFDDTTYTKMKNIFFDTMKEIGNETWEQIKQFK